MRRIALVALVLLLAAAPSASAQIVASGPVVYGHHHLAVSDAAAHRRFWIDSLGGAPAKVGAGTTEAIQFPNVFLLLRPQAPSGGTKGTTVNHIGFSVPALRPVLDRVAANGFRIVTRDEVAPTQAVENGIAVLGPTAAIAFVMGPDEVKVELVEVRAQAQPIALHHVHFFGPDRAGMQAWYAKVFGATPRGGAGAFVSAALPGVTLNFTESADPVVGTTGRALDHIGFEIDNLEAFVTRLEADGVPMAVSYRQVPQSDIWIAFITDPWGTSIELSEGLDRIR